MAGDRRCRFGRHVWAREGGARTCIRCGARRRSRKSPLCYVGIHNWTPTSKDGAQFVECRYCLKYGGDVPTWWPYRRPPRPER